MVLVSLDGCRWDFLDRGVTPNLAALAERGVRAERLIPSFPTKTFPNHYTLVTGLRPAQHGLVANNIWDESIGVKFSLSNREAVADGRWYGGEPVWVTAEREGIATAPLFWPGSEASISGVRPTHSLAYDGSMAPEDRVAWVLERLALPASERPRFLTLYFESIDDVAHRFGPEPSAELAHTLEQVDGYIGRLVEGVNALGLDDSVNILVVSDHGMAANSRDRVIFLDQYLDIERAGIVDWDPILALWPEAEVREETYAALAGAHPHLKVYRRDEIPPGYRFSDNSRIAPIVGIADDGWAISTKARFESCSRCFTGGSHGYDHRLPSMGGIFVAAGPAVRSGVALPPTSNVDLYQVMMRILGLAPAANAGDPATADAVLRD